MSKRSSIDRPPPRKSAARKTAGTKTSAPKAGAKHGSSKPKVRKQRAVTAPNETAAASPTLRTPAQRDRRFGLLLQTACLKAGSGAAIATMTRKVPLLSKLAPMLLGSVGEAISLGRVHHQLVRDVLDLYDLELSELEERGVILLATAVNEGAHQLSRQMVERIVDQLGGRYLKPLANRFLPLASLVTEIAGAIAGTYAVGKRAQALCNLPGSGARNLAELLRGLSGIDESRLFSWSGEALRLSLLPFRSVMGWSK